MPRPRKHIAKKRRIDDGTEEGRIIYEHYNKYRVSDKVNSTKVNANRALRDDMYVEQMYKTFKMRKYDNRQDFEKAMTSKFPYKQDELDTLWREYEHRDMLIRTGQYEEIRYQYYRDKYVAAMELRNVDSKYVNRIKSLSLEQWKQLINVPNSSKSRTDDKALPVLGGGFVSTQPGASDDIKTQEFIKLLERAFSLAGIPLEDKEQLSDAIEEASNDDERMDRTITRGYRLLNKERRQAIYDEGSDSELLLSLGDELARQYESRGRTYETSKKGYRYIRGVGSTNPDTKNYLLALAIISHMK